MTPHKKKQIITGALMTTAMAFALSGFFSLINIGFNANWPPIWAKGFFMGWPVGFLVSSLVGPRVQRLAAHLSGESS